MSIKINSNFSVGTSLPIDDRLVLTKQQMLNINDNVMPNVYLTMCEDDGNLYFYNKTNTYSTETGRFRQSYNTEDVNKSISFSNYLEFPNVGESNVLYIATDTDMIYRWNNDLQIYVMLSEPTVEIINGIL